MGDELEIEYCGYEARNNQTICTWEIKLASGVDWNDLDSLKEWTENKVNLGQYVGIWFKRINKGQFPPKYNLNIRGIGEDGRCAFCRRFRTGLKKKTKDNALSYSEIGKCDFE